MIEYKLGHIEMRFADLIWTNEPIPSGELIKLAEASISRKKSTTYTILRKPCKVNGLWKKPFRVHYRSLSLRFQGERICLTRNLKKSNNSLICIRGQKC